MGSDDGAARRGDRWNCRTNGVACAVAAPVLLLCGFLATRMEYSDREKRWQVSLPSDFSAASPEWLKTRSADDRDVGLPTGAKTLGEMEASLKSLHAKLAHQETSLDETLGRHVDRHMARIEGLIAERGERRHKHSTETAASHPAASAHPPASPPCDSFALAPPPVDIVAARGENYWPFQRNEFFFNTTARPPPCTKRCTSVQPFPMFVHDPKICRFISGEILSRGHWEPQLTLELLEHLGPPSSGRVFLDIGSNIGWFSLTAAAAGHRVIAIDALRTNVELLMRSISANPQFQELIEVFHYAVSSSGGSI
jgi:2-polyprenyl-3-methyl-5-hydroxy-6-metoxy-1,4-benzoquinol methylase